MSISDGALRGKARYILEMFDDNPNERATWNVSIEWLEKSKISRGCKRLMPTSRSLSAKYVPVIIFNLCISAPQVELSVFSRSHERTGKAKV